MTCKQAITNKLRSILRAKEIHGDASGYRVVTPDNGHGYAYRSIRFDALAGCARLIGHISGNTGNEMFHLAILCNRFFRRYKPTIK